MSKYDYVHLRDYDEEPEEGIEIEEALCFECAKSIANCECPDGFYLGDALKESE